MKKLLLIVLITAATSCSKQRGGCYTCTFGTINGYQPPAEEYCGPMPYVKKINGNEVNTFCVPK